MPERASRPAPARVRVEGHERIALTAGWELAPCPPDAQLDPARLEGLSWLPAQVPGTAAGALRAAGLWRFDRGRDFDAEDWWFRMRFRAEPAHADEEVALELDGLATVAEVFLNGEPVLASQSMLAAHAIDVGALLRGENELTIRCRALAPLLAQRRKPRARWRTLLVNGNLRFFRTMLLGRAPGFANGPAAVGPWRPVRLVRRRRLAVERLTARTRLEGEDGLVLVEALLRPLGQERIEAVTLQLAGPSGADRVELALESDAEGHVRARGTLRVPAVAPWWPHTHGQPTLHDARLLARTAAGDALALDIGRLGFRRLAPGPQASHDVEADGLDLHVNGVRVFARGAVWTPCDFVGLAPDRATLRRTLETVREAGMNMLRVPGTAAYESEDFYDLCDELGLLVWQDFMFANLDYPIAEEGFRASVQAEAEQTLQRLAGRPSLAVLCGNSEVEQQVAMLGLDPALGRGELFGRLLPAAIEEAGCDAVYVPSAPCGGALPFHPDSGIANYYGVGGYRRPLQDARRAGVRFAAECLAFANVPDEEGVLAVLPDGAGELAVHDPRWKAGVPRDVGTGWDFEDVRDHYLSELFGVDPGELRRVDHGRYLELSRAVTGEAMAEVFGEWRRAASPCGGGLVLWLADLRPGAGWGVLDHSGRPKPAYHHLRRALAPVAVWMTDEGLNGVSVHVANDSPRALRARLRVTLYRDGQQRLAEGEERLELPAHGCCERDAESLLGRFADASWAYRFGPPAHDTIVASLEPEGEGGEPICQAFRFPAGRPLREQAIEELGLVGELVQGRDGAASLTLRCRRLAYGVRIHVPGFLPADDALTLEPMVARTISLRAGAEAASASGGGTLTALNLRGHARIVTGEGADG